MGYWETRAEARQNFYDRASAKTLHTVNRAFDRMVKQLHHDTERIIGNFAHYFELSRTEAMKMLREPAPQSVLDDLRARLSTITDEGQRLALQARLSAPAYAARITRNQAIQEAARVNAVQAADVEARVGQIHMRDMLHEGFDRTMYDIQKYTGLGFGFSGVDRKRLDQILRYNWSGRHFSERVWLNSRATARQLSSALTEVILQGKTSRQTFDELMAASGGSRMAANRLLRTETNYITNQATAEAYEQAGITKYRYMAVLDGRTSTLCQEKDGEVFELAKAEVGVNYPPLHPFCRSQISPVIDGFNLAEMKRWARDPATGEEMKVSASMSYREWKASLNLEKP